VNLAIQFILNCGTEVAGSCHGGSATGAYQFVHDAGYVPFDTCLQYEACSSESKEGSCGHTDYSCSGINTCRTCSTFSEFGGFCSALNAFPNATIGEYGEVRGEHEIMAEIYARGPVAAGIDATLLDEYVGGIITETPSYEINHIVSIVGWGETDPETDPETGEPVSGGKGAVKYWIARNSWGEYWGEMGFFRLVRGVKALGIEDECSWATPKTWTDANVACFEDGANCASARVSGTYVDPSRESVAVGEKMTRRA
jgi:cathepsin X